MSIRIKGKRLPSYVTKQETKYTKIKQQIQPTYVSGIQLKSASILEHGILI